MITRAQDKRSIQLEMDLKVNEPSLNDMVSQCLKKSFKENIRERTTPPIKHYCPDCFTLNATMTTENWKDAYKSTMYCEYCGYDLHYYGNSAVEAEHAMKKEYQELISAKVKNEHSEEF